MPLDKEGVSVTYPDETILQEPLEKMIKTAVEHDRVVFLTGRSNGVPYLLVALASENAEHVRAAQQAVEWILCDRSYDPTPGNQAKSR